MSGSRLWERDRGKVGIIAEVVHVRVLGVFVWSPRVQERGADRTPVFAADDQMCIVFGCAPALPAGRSIAEHSEDIFVVRLQIKQLERGGDKGQRDVIVFVVRLRGRVVVIVPVRVAGGFCDESARFFADEPAGVVVYDEPSWFGSTLREEPSRSGGSCT